MANRDIRRVVGQNLHRLRAAAGLTQENLAAKSGISTFYISGIESGRRNPSVIVLAELAQVLGVDVRELLNPSAGDAP
ncbi:MAG: helix-turn-helix transcriptional regulator [Stellaceae bacterium]